MNRDPKAWTRLGQLIRDARVQRNLSREELAERAGVADRSVYSAEVGYGTKPPMRMSPPPTLVKIVAALGWEPSCIPTVLDGGNPIPVGQPAPEARPIEPARNQASLWEWTSAFRWKTRSRCWRVPSRAAS